MKLYEELKWRGFIKDVSNEELANEFLNGSGINFYCGFDPTADSLTIGHLVQIIRILLLQNGGHRPIVLIGGGTGSIGDPSGRSSERKLLSMEETFNNVERFKTQFSKFVSTEGTNGAILVNNYDWLSKINCLEFLRDYGKNFTVNYMLAKDTVASRLETGISYTEFSYMIIQALDFLHLYDNYNCKLQFGGSDQWGNITAGLDLIRKNRGDNTKVLGMTSPLLTKADGSKFSKSEGGAIWLDEKKTTPYELYQFFLNSTDLDVINYLKTLTLIEREEIEKLEVSLKTEPEKRLAQKRLAHEIVRFVHGIDAADKVVSLSEEIFSKGNTENIPTIKLDITESNINVLDLLVLSNLCSSKSEARRLIEQGGISIDKKKVTSVNEIVKTSNKLIIQKGKKTFIGVSFNE